MRRPVQVVLIAIIVLLVAASAVLFQNYRKTKANLAETQASEQNVRSNYAEAINSIAEIQDSLNAITVGTGNLRMRPQGLAAEQRTPSRQEALESISLLNASIQRTRDKIHQLESNLHKSGVKIAGLQRMITDLKTNLTTRESQVAELTTQVESLHTQVSGLETTVAQAQDTIQAKDQFLEDRRRELATVSYIIGSKRDLKNQGVIVTQGGVLGLGKTPQLSGRYNESLFTNIDTDQETVIHAPADKVDKVKILSGQPATSYTMTLEGNQVAIHIVNPAEFRKFRHLVIMTS
jgi:hypothetical protein